MLELTVLILWPILILGMFLFVVLPGYWLQSRFRKMFISWQLVDNPDAQLKTHKQPVPYSGGPALFCNVTVALLILAGLGWLFSMHITQVYQSLMMLPRTFAVFLISLFAPVLHLLSNAAAIPKILLLLSPFFLLGFIDDRYNLSQKLKFLLQVLLVLNFIYWTGLSLSWWQWLFSLAIINAFNLIDVADGLCAMVASFTALNLLITLYLFGVVQTSGIIVRAEGLILLLACLQWAIMPFLSHNISTEKCYLGDGGATFLGACLGLLPWVINWPSTVTQIFSLGTIFAVPLAEVLMLVIIRSWLGIAPYRGSRHHFVHFLLHKGWGLINILYFVTFVEVMLILLNIAFLACFISPGLLIILQVLAFVLWLTIVYV